MAPSRDIIQRFVSQDLLKREIGHDDELLLSGLLDSIAVVHLIAFVEESFNIKIPPEDLTIVNMGSVSKIADYVENSR